MKNPISSHLALAHSFQVTLDLLAVDDLRYVDTGGLLLHSSMALPTHLPLPPLFISIIFSPHQDVESL